MKLFQSKLGLRALLAVPMATIALSLSAQTQSSSVKLLSRVGYTLPAADQPQPLFVVDEKEISRGEFEALNGDAVANLVILRGKEARTKYGDRGRMGVIQVTMRQGAAVEGPEIVVKAPDTPEAVVEVADVMPQFPGGLNAMMQYLSENVTYPVEAVKQGIEGRVVLSFVVERDGSLSNVTIIRSVDPLLDAEAVRVVSSMPLWSPGLLGGRKVRVKYGLPISFKL